MIAHGLRMMTQGMFFPNSIYQAPVPTGLDFWFDWFTLCLIGIIIFYIGWKQWLFWMRQSKKKRSSDKRFMIVPT